MHLLAEFFIGVELESKLQHWFYFFNPFAIAPDLSGRIQKRFTLFTWESKEFDFLFTADNPFHAPLGEAIGFPEKTNFAA